MRPHLGLPRDQREYTAEDIRNWADRRRVLGLLDEAGFQTLMDLAEAMEAGDV